MANGTGPDVIEHFKEGVQAIRRYPMLIVPPLAVQVVVFGLALVVLGGAAGMAMLGGMTGGIVGLLTGGAVLMLVGGLLSLLASGVVIVMAREALAARQPGLGEALRAVSGRFADVLIASFLLTLIVGLGMLLFVVPGLVAAFFLIFTLPAVLLDGQGAVDALRRSATLVRANIGTVLALMIGCLLAAVLVAIVSRILGLVPILGHLASAALAGGFIAYLSVVGVRVYQSLSRG